MDSDYYTLYNIREVARLSNAGIKFKEDKLVFQMMKSLVDNCENSLLSAELSKIMANIVLYYMDDEEELFDYLIEEVNRIMTDVETEINYNQLVSSIENIYPGIEEAPVSSITYLDSVNVIEDDVGRKIFVKKEHMNELFVKFTLFLDNTPFPLPWKCNITVGKSTNCEEDIKITDENGNSIYVHSERANEFVSILAIYNSQRKD